MRKNKMYKMRTTNEQRHFMQVLMVVTGFGSFVTGVIVGWWLL